MRDVLILTSGQEEHPYVARNFRDHLEELAGSDLRVEVRELGQDGLQGWLMWLRERLQIDQTLRQELLTKRKKLEGESEERILKKFPKAVKN